MKPVTRLVLDTNILVRGLANRRSASGRLLRLTNPGRMKVLLSREIISEYTDVLARDELSEMISMEDAHLVLSRLRYFGDLIDPIRIRFEYDRDPKDELVIELAIAGNATHLITYDKDLLSLTTGHSDAAKRLRQRSPQLQITDAVTFMSTLET